MAIRTDIITIDWTSSPRVIWINISETETDVQDLYDTCRYYEYQHDGMDEPSLCDAGGKEPLGGTVSVGITVSLFNAVYAFADRPGPDWVICNMTGGNVVGFTDATRTTQLYPRKPTAYVSADRSSSSSATLQEQDAIQYSSFGGGVTIDVINGFSGTDYPTGTPQKPSNNIADTHTIAAERGFPNIFVIGDLPLVSSVPALKGHTFIGSGKDRTEIDIDTAADVEDCAYMEAHILGTLDGNSRLQDCVIDNLVYVKGYIEQCVLAPGTIVLAGTEEAHFLDCWSGEPGTGTPTIDLGGGGQALALRNYNGGISLINKTGPESVSIDLNSGQVKIDMATVTNGTIVVRGIGKLTELTTGLHIDSGTYGSLTLINELVNVHTIVDATWEKDISEIIDDTSIGYFIYKKLLKTITFLGNK